MKIKAKKSLGQNFLTDKKIIEKIIDCSIIKDKDILEVGPGTGNLTEEIIKKNPKKIYLVEKDNYLIEILKKKFNYNIEFINNDILEIEEKKLSENKLIVFGNLPYNISTEILINWIVNIKKVFWFEKLILMFQKEVANRIISSHNNSSYGRLSIISQWKLDIVKILDIEPNSFQPKPKVDSTLLVFKPKENYEDICSEKSLEQITRIFFNQRRKKIKKSFNQIFDNSREISDKLDIDLDLRPQNLDYKTYLLIARELDNLRS
ncbi:16S rRNA (adenine(1518)-N(6)/adenine(1519)-N(6))-dimethyltransferase RsmA [Candidatus Pelagibacter sp.]|nr:16S rRNA (adenine(1518)-N(6)/adenine(1519)-N(6))-dimethyltransferase RsmA [Candidatus Pelagibacter sp.]